MKHEYKLMDPKELVIIGRDTNDGPEHPRYDIRAHHDPEEGIVNGMMQSGVEYPIAVVLGKNDRLEVLDGRQRVINAREANVRLAELGGVPIKVKVSYPKPRDDKGTHLASIVRLNEHRRQDSPLGRAQKAQSLFNFGYSEDEIAAMFNVAVSTVRNYASLMNLLPEIQEMIARDEVSATKAYTLAGKSEKDQKAFLLRLKNGNRSGKHKTRAPSKRHLRNIVEIGPKTLPASFLAGIRYALGMTKASEVNGFPEDLWPKVRTEPKLKPRKVRKIVPGEKKSTKVITGEKRSTRAVSRTAVVSSVPVSTKTKVKEVRVDGETQYVPITVCPPAPQESSKRVVGVPTEVVDMPTVN